MFRDLVSPRSSAAAELEAITAERDFFKEKYAAHASEMEALRTQLKESQRMVDKLRNQVLDLGQQVMELEGEKSRGGAGGEKAQVVGSSRTPSLTEITDCGAREPSKGNEIDSQQPRRNSSIVLGEFSTPSANKKLDAKEDENNSEKENNDENEENDSDEEKKGESDDDVDDDDSHDNDEADAIRLKASRMLAWASYQSTRRTPSKLIAGDDDDDDDDDGFETPDQTTNWPSAAYTLPAKIQSLLNDDEDTNASLLVEHRQVTSDSKHTANGGGIGKFVNNLKDMIGTQSESDSSYEDDNASMSDSECSNLSEHLARMHLGVHYADSLEEH